MRPIRGHLSTAFHHQSLKSWSQPELQPDQNRIRPTLQFSTSVGYETHTSLASNFAPESS
jgi:hypothetical protein